jgi:hypothetical protein
MLVKDALISEQSIQLKETTAATPSAGYAAIYAKSDNGLYYKNDEGTERAVATVKQTGTGTGTTIFVQLSGEAAPSGMVAGDIKIQVT